MGKIDRDFVRKLGELAQLSLTDEECDRFRDDIEQILGYAERIQSLETEGVVPTSHALLEAALEGENAFREDEPAAGLDPKSVLEAAPDDGDGLFKVPKVIP